MQMRTSIITCLFSDRSSDYVWLIVANVFIQGFIKKNPQAKAKAQGFTIFYVLSEAL
jgi:hypothetical protein